jgi:hypothetical protein
MPRTLLSTGRGRGGRRAACRRTPRDARRRRRARRRQRAPRRARRRPDIAEGAPIEAADDGDIIPTEALEDDLDDDSDGDDVAPDDVAPGE